MLAVVPSQTFVIPLPVSLTVEVIATPVKPVSFRRVLLTNGADACGAATTGSVVSTLRLVIVVSEESPALLVAFIVIVFSPSAQTTFVEE